MGTIHACWGHHYTLSNQKKHLTATEIHKDKIWHNIMPQWEYVKICVILQIHLECVGVHEHSALAMNSWVILYKGLVILNTCPEAPCPSDSTNHIIQISVSAENFLLWFNLRFDGTKANMGCGYTVTYCLFPAPSHNTAHQSTLSKQIILNSRDYIWTPKA